MSASFTTARPDGRSDKRVILDLVGEGEPGTMFTYEMLTAELSAGLDHEVDRGRIYRAVAQADRILLKEQRRHLEVVKDVGYRVVRADEHLPVAVGKKERAETFIRRGVELLRHARIDELTAAQRTLHEGQLMVLVGLHQAMQHSEERHRRQEGAIEELRQRLTKIEGGDQT